MRVPAGTGWNRLEPYCPVGECIGELVQGCKEGVGIPRGRGRMGCGDGMCDVCEFFDGDRDGPA